MPDRLDEMKDHAAEYLTEASQGSIRVFCTRHRDASPNEPHEIHVCQWDGKRHHRITDDEARKVLAREVSDE